MTVSQKGAKPEPTDRLVVRDIRKHFPRGMTKSFGKFLCHVVKLQTANGWNPVSQREIFAAVVSSPTDLRLSPSMAKNVAAELQELAWVGQRPYLVGSKSDVQGYTVKDHPVPTYLLTVRIACALLRWDAEEDARIPLTEVAARFPEGSVFDKAIQFLEKREYIERCDGLRGVCVRRLPRLGFEKEYLVRAEKILAPVEFPAGAPKSRRSRENAVVRPDVTSSGDVVCSWLGTDEAAMHYVLEQLHVERSPRVVKIRNAHVRTDKPEGISRVPLAGLQPTFRAFLQRSDPESKPSTFVFGQLFDAEYAKVVQRAAEGMEDAVRCYRLTSNGPIMNFLILDCEDGSSEVLFGWGQSAPGRPGAVFCSRDDRLVNEFNVFFVHLIDCSTRTTLASLHRRVEQIEAFQDWPAKRFSELLDEVEAGGELKILTTCFHDVHSLNLAALVRRNCAVKIIMTNPDNAALIHARFWLRRDMKPVATQRLMRAQLAELRDIEELVRSEDESCTGTLEVRLSDTQPCGFVAMNNRRVLVGLMIAQLSYIGGPAIEITPSTTAWKRLNHDWAERWNDAYPHSPKSWTGTLRDRNRE